jgi:dTDP-glucose pyrophosphorylase
MKVVIPLAGRGSRFAERGIQTPKPLISVAGRPMVGWALESLAGIAYRKIYFIALAEHEREYGIVETLRGVAGPEAEVLLLDDVTEGQLCTVLAARDALDEDEGVLVASADTLVVSEFGRDISDRAVDCRGIISVADMPGDRWSFARTDSRTGRVVEVAEKVRISDHASTGMYYFASGRELVSTAEDLIRAQEKTRGEYYVIPVYQRYVRRGWPVDISIASEFWDMGTPEGLKIFENRFASTV